jgi:hypothetical protein
MTGASNKFFLAGCLFGLSGLVVLRLFDPATTHLFPPCPVHYLTGWYCPGCGSLRAMHQLLHGNFGTAFSMNPLFIIALPFLIYGLTLHVLSVVSGRQFTSSRLPSFWIWNLAAAIVLFGIARNLPFAPFHWLAPGGISGV